VRRVGSGSGGLGAGRRPSSALVGAAAGLSATARHGARGLVWLKLLALNLSEPKVSQRLVSTSWA